MQNKAKVDYEVKSLAADRAKTAYETIKAKYEEAEAKRLAELADAKRKELEKAGYQPVPVVDGKGNVVDYKAEKVGHKPVPVVDNKGNVVDYKAEKVGHKPVPVVDTKENVVDYTAEKVTVGTKDDKTYQAPAQATNAKVESKKQLPNTGSKESGLLAMLGASVGLLAFAGKRKFR